MHDSDKTVIADFFSWNRWNSERPDREDTLVCTAPRSHTRDGNSTNTGPEETATQFSAGLRSSMRPNCSRREMQGRRRRLRDGERLTQQRRERIRRTSSETARMNSGKKSTPNVHGSQRGACTARRASHCHAQRLGKPHAANVRPWGRHSQPHTQTFPKAKTATRNMIHSRHPQPHTQTRTQQAPTTSHTDTHNIKTSHTHTHTHNKHSQHRGITDS